MRDLVSGRAMSPSPALPTPRPAPAPANRRRRWWREHAPLGLILAAFAVLAAIYGATVPLGEPPDELAHYRYVRYIDATGRPPLTPEEREASGYKGHEPPLYYLLLHRATSWAGIARHDMLKIIDPDLEPRHSLGGEALLWNAVLHTADETFPWRGTSLAWHLMRLVSIPLGMVTIMGVYRVGRLLAPGRPAVAILAAGLTAFTPQFVYLSGAVNNDNLAIPLAVLTLATLVSMARQGTDGGDLRWRQFLLVGVLAGLARVTKFHTLVLLPVIVLALTLIAWRRRAWWRCALGGALALTLLVCVSAPWILAVQPDGATPAAGGLVSAFVGLSDVKHAGDLAAGGGSGGLGAMLGLLWGVLKLEPLRWAVTLFRSYWAFFGQMTVTVGDGIYLGLAVVAACGAVGALRLVLARRALPLGAVILALGAIAFLGVEVLFYALMRRLPDTAQGRHLYPALPAWSLLLAAGLLAWAPARHAWRITAGLLLALAALAIYVLPAYALAAYEPPLPVRTTLPASWQPAVVAHGAGEDAPSAAPGIAYLGCGPAVAEGAAGDIAEITLLWRATAPIREEYLLRIEYADAAGVWRLLHLAQPVDGRWPTRAWDPGDYVRDAHALLVPPALPVGEYPLRAVWADGDGRPVGAAVAGCRLRVTHAGPPPPQLVAHRVPAAATGPLRQRQGMTVLAFRAAPHTAALDPTLSEALTSDDGQEWRPLATTTHPVTGGEVIQAFYVVTPHTPPGRYAPASAPEVRVDARFQHFDLPEDMRPAGWRFAGPAEGGDAITLAGYRLDGGQPDGGEGPAVSARPGETLGLSLAWRAEGWIARNYTVFTHLVGADDVPVAQHDAIPRDGYATLFWAPGEVVVDYHPLTLPADLPPGTYRILVGLYTRPDGARLPVTAPGPSGASEGGEATAAVVTVVHIVNEGEH